MLQVSQLAKPLLGAKPSKFRCTVCESKSNARTFPWDDLPGQVDDRFDDGSANLPDLGVGQRLLGVAADFCGRLAEDRMLAQLVGHFRGRRLVQIDPVLPNALLSGVSPADDD